MQLHFRKFSFSITRLHAALLSVSSEKIDSISSITSNAVSFSHNRLPQLPTRRSPPINIFRFYRGQFSAAKSCNFAYRSSRIKRLSIDLYTRMGRLSPVCT